MIIQQGIEVTLLKNCWSCTDAYGRVINGKPAMQEDDGTCSICSGARMVLTPFGEEVMELLTLAGVTTTRKLK
jgi:hypothetical protein